MSCQSREFSKDLFRRSEEWNKLPMDFNREHMKAFGHVELTTEELPDGLRFRVERTQGWFVPLAAIFTLLGVLLIFAFRHDPGLFFGLAVVAAVGVAGLAIRWAVTRDLIYTTILTVTSQSFIAEGDGIRPRWKNRHRSSNLVVPVAGIKKIGYQSGGEDAPCGLYLNCGFFNNSCVLPGLNPVHARAVTTAILRRFPELGPKMPLKN